MRSLGIGLLCAALAGTPATAQSAADNPQLLAQAIDRCMATYAVRLIGSGASDDAIFGEAQRGCQPLNDRLAVALNAAISPAQAAPMLRQLEASAKPNFLNLLARIRSDRAGRAGG